MKETSVDIFLIFCSKHCGYTLEPPLCFEAKHKKKNMYTPANPSFFSIYMWSSREYTFHGHDFLMFVSIGLELSQNMKTIHHQHKFYIEPFCIWYIFFVRCAFCCITPHSTAMVMLVRCRRLMGLTSNIGM